MPLILSSEGKGSKKAKIASAKTEKNAEAGPHGVEGHSTEEESRGSSEAGGKTAENRAVNSVNGRRASDFFQPIMQKIFTAVASGNITEAFRNLSDEIKVFLNCESLVIYSVDRSANQLFARNFISKNGEDNKRVDISNNSLAGFVANSGKDINISDAYSSEDLSRYPGLKHDAKSDKRLKMKTKSAMVLPVYHQDNLIGVLEIINNLRGESFSAPMPNVAVELAKALGPALDKLESEEYASKLRSIGLATHRASVSEEDLFQLTKPIIDLFNAELMSLYFVNEPKKEIFTKVKTDENMVVRSLSISNNSIAGWVAKKKKLVNIADVYDAKELRMIDPELKHDDSWDRSVGSKTRVMLCCPLMHNGLTVGVLQVIKKTSAHKFNSSDEKNIIALAQMLGIAIHNNIMIIKSKSHKFSYLINHGLMSGAELDSAIASSRKQSISIDDVMLDGFNIKRADMGKSLEEFYGIPYYGFDEKVILPKHFFVGLNLKFLMKNFWVPVQNDDRLVVVLVDNPMDNEKVRNIKMTFPKKEIQFRVGLRVDILNFLNAGAAVEDEPAPMPDVDEDVSSLLESLETSQHYEDGISEAEDIEDEGSISESDNSIVRLVNKIIIDAYVKGVSDIHIEPGINKKPLLVRYRIEGECEQVEKIPFNYKFALVSRIKIMAKLDITEKRLPQDGKIKINYGKAAIELRVATCPTVGKNEDIVMRILAASKPIPLDKYLERETSTRREVSRSSHVSSEQVLGESGPFSG